MTIRRTSGELGPVSFIVAFGHLEIRFMLNYKRSANLLLVLFHCNKLEKINQMFSIRHCLVYNNLYQLTEMVLIRSNCRALKRCNKSIGTYNYLSPIWIWS